MKTIAFFNNKSGVGKTSLVYHLAWMFAEHNVPVLAVDLDPQANLTAMFLDEEPLMEIWLDDDSYPYPATVYDAVRPILHGFDDITIPPVRFIDWNFGLLPGDLELSSFEDKLSADWSSCQNSDEAAFRTVTAFHRVIEAMAGDWARLVLIDIGPNLGAINRSALIASDHVCVPLTSDLFALQGLKNLGPTLAQWRTAWKGLRSKAPKGLSLPSGTMDPIGYVITEHGIHHSDRPVKAYRRWMEKIPPVYRSFVLGEEVHDGAPQVGDDPYCLAQLKHYRSLMPLAMESHKPMFHLKPADGAIGAHVEAVRDCYQDFLMLARRIGTSVGITLD